MTSNSSATIDPENPLKGTSQSSNDNDDSHTPVAKPNDEEKVEAGSENAQAKSPAYHSAAGRTGEEHTGSQPEELDDFGLPIPVRPRPSQAADESEDTPQENHPDARDSQKGVETERKLATPDETTEKQATALETKEQLGDEGKQAPANDEGGLSEKNPNTLHGDQTPTVTSGATEDVQAGRASTSENTAPTKPQVSRNKSSAPKPSEWSHQRLTAAQESEDEESEEESEQEWREMPALGEFDEYDDFGRLLARGARREAEEEKAHKGLGNVGKGYTRVQLDEDAQSATSLDEDTSYLFRENAGNSAGVEGEEMRDAVSQLQATKDILTEGQRIAYVGVTRLSIHQMELELQAIPATKGARKTIQKCRDSTKMWGQAIMARLYAHMEIDPAEQIMIEQLTQHGVQPDDLVPPLMQNARIKNPLADEDEGKSKEPASPVTSPTAKEKESKSDFPPEEEVDRSETPPPPYEAHEDEPPEVQSPSQLPTSTNIDIDLRWTVLCDLFLVLIADSAYDARSRALLERVGKSLEVSWLQITRFEKRVIDALEMQEEEENIETWDEAETMEKRQRMAKKRRYMVMGLATVGGGLVIGLSAGLLAPVIGAGLAAGFTTVGISGTSAFLGGTGGTALIASSATMAGSSIGLKASHRRTGAVRTFEYRPLHNNRRVNLIVTVAGWMTGKVDDVRLPYSTVDPIMGDLYSVLWEPEMLRSMGETINILATEALTQGLQHVLGSTVLVALMASLQLPLVLTKLSYLIDNPWNVSLARASAAGLILADSLMVNHLGKRPITLLGFSLGSRVIFSCLKELAEKGAQGIVQNVYMFGSPIVANKDDFLKARSVVSGRFVNGYASNDWILGYLFRATSGGIMRVAGLAPVEGIPGLENFDGTNLVNGHMDYRSAMPRLLKEVGWEVLSEEFAEIEDPDPENHGERQRELIREIDEARRDAELKPEKKRFGLFKRGKLAQKKGWETYDVDRNASMSPGSPDSMGSGSVLFDIDAIKAELASESIEVKQLESTLPPMKLDLNSPPAQSPTTPSTADTKEPSQPQPQSQSQPQSTPTTQPPVHRPLHEEEEIEMTFDTSYDDLPPRSHSVVDKSLGNSHDPPPTRPELRSTVTTPAGVGAGVGAGAGAGAGVGAAAVGAMSLEPNAWTEHDLGGGDEGEIEMSFE